MKTSIMLADYVEQNAPYIQTVIADNPDMCLDALYDRILAWAEAETYLIEDECTANYLAILGELKCLS